MFYSQVILARKGPLGKIWLAAHFDRKLTKNQVFTTDISESVDFVLNPTSPLALRVSGHLMLGIVKIYSKKVQYFMSDCQEAMWFVPFFPPPSPRVAGPTHLPNSHRKIKLAFRPGNYDLAEGQVAAAAAIDDPRFFGNIVPENDYPELEDAAFSQNMLSNYASMRAARGRTLASQQDTTQQEDFEYPLGPTRSSSSGGLSQSPAFGVKPSPASVRSAGAAGDSGLLNLGHIPGEEGWQPGQGSGERSRLSDVEVGGSQRTSRAPFCCPPPPPHSSHLALSDPYQLPV